MFDLSIIGTKNGANAISVSHALSLHNIRDLSKKFRKSRLPLERGRAILEICLIHALLQFCEDSLLGYDIKRAEISRMPRSED